MATCSIISFPRQSRPARKKHPKEQCRVLDWIRNGYQFPGKEPGPPKPLPPPGLPPTDPNPLPPIQTPPKPDNPPRKPGEKGSVR